MIRWLLLTLVLPGLALAHGDRPRVVGLVFPPGGEADTVYALTDQQGLFANPKSGFRWLCEDAVAPLAGLRGLAFAGQRLVAATSVGLFASEDGGCGWARVEGPPAGHRLAGLWTHPTDGGWLVASQGEGVLNGVWRSDDEGETWTMAMPALRGRVRDLRWAVSDADRVYLGTTEGNWRSDDGGRSFAPLVVEAPIAPPVQPSEARLLAVDPDDADVVFATVERLPETFVLRSTDGGATFAEVLRVPDFDLSMVFVGDDEALLLGPATALWRSADRGRTFVEEPTPVAGLGCLTPRPDGRLWACADLYAGGPFAVGVSDDGGRSFAPMLARFQDAAERWDCAPAQRALACCAGLCPGEAVGFDCGQVPAPPDQAAQCAQAAGPAPVALDGGVDAMPVDAAPVDAALLDVAVIDARADAAPAAEGDGDGCAVGPAPGGRAAWWLFGCVAIMRRQKSRR